jgi:hypothetical protein
MRTPVTALAGMFAGTVLALSTVGTAGAAPIAVARHRGRIGRGR